MTKQNFDRIHEIVASYGRLDHGHNQINELMSMRRELSSLGVRLADFVGDIARDYKAAYGQRKIQFAKVKEKHRQGGESVAGSESIAETATELLRDQEVELEGRFQKGKLLLDSIHKVLDSMAGEINFLIREKTTVSHRQN